MCVPRCLPHPRCRDMLTDEHPNSLRSAVTLRNILQPVLRGGRLSTSPGGCLWAGTSALRLPRVAALHALIDVQSGPALLAGLLRCQRWNLEQPRRPQRTGRAEPRLRQAGRQRGVRAELVLHMSASLSLVKGWLSSNLPSIRLTSQPICRQTPSSSEQSPSSHQKRGS